MKYLQIGFCGSAALLAAVPAMTAWPTPAVAQGVFPCGGGPNEEQIGVDRQGPVTVPLCIERQGREQGNSPGSSEDSYVYIPRHVPPPKGWKRVYGAWKGFEIKVDPVTGRYSWDYVISLGHATPEEAKTAARELCLARKPIFAESSPSTCQGFVIDDPYVIVIRYPDVDYFGSQRGSYFVNSSNIPEIEGLVERGPGRWDVCSERLRDEGQCANVVALLENGIIP